MKCYIADAFTDTVFKGNPAAVCLPEQWIPDELMQNIARENNLSETAFTVTKGDAYELRWISFLTKSGELTVRKKDGRYELDMPSYPLHRIPVTEEMAAAVGFMPAEAWLVRDLVCGSAPCRLLKEAVFYTAVFPGTGFSLLEKPPYTPSLNCMCRKGGMTYEQQKG